MPTLIQRSFSSGEIAPGLYARADQARYAAGLRTCRNFIVKAFGPIANRPGTRHVHIAKDQATPAALLPFVFSNSQSYLLEFGDTYLRIHKAGAPLVTSGVSAWSNVTTYQIGDLATYGGITYYCFVSNIAEQPDLYPNRWYPLTAGVYEIPTPYAAADVGDLHVSQSADVVTITHPAYPVYELKRFAETTWTMAPAVFGSSVDAPTGISGSGTAGGLSFEYAVTAVDSDGHESLQGASAALVTATIIGIAGGIQISGLIPVTKNAIVNTSSAHGFTSGQKIIISGTTFTGSYNPNGQTFTITVVDSTHFQLNGFMHGFATNYVSGGTATLLDVGLTALADPSVHAITVTWTAVFGAMEYNLYRKVNGVWGFIGSARGASFVDNGILPDTAVRPPTEKTPFAGPGDFPATCAFYQQRQAFAGSDNGPLGLKSSRIGEYRNFNKSNPGQDDDPVTFDLAGERIARIRHLLDLGRLVILTEGGEYAALGDQSGAFIPTAPNLRQQGANGAAKARPVVVGDTALYVQARGARMRTLRYDFQTDGYHGEDLSIFAPHLVEGYAITVLAYAQEPLSIVWATRSDGTLLGMTFNRDQQVVGWHRHDSETLNALSRFERVCCIPEGDEDAVYVLVKRYIDGAWTRHIERFASRLVVDVAKDSYFVDDGITYDGTNATGTTLSATGGSTWAAGEALTLVASAGIFASGDVGNAFDLRTYDLNGTLTDTLRLTVTAYTNATHVTVTAARTVPAAFRAAPMTTWAKALLTIPIGTHLEGEHVVALADGAVVKGLVVTDAVVILDTPAAVCHVGLPITADAETLDLETLQAETLVNKRKRVNGVTFLVEESLEIQAGPDADNLRGFIARGSETYDQPTVPFTGAIEIMLDTTWQDESRIFIRHSEPVPITVLAIAPLATIGG